MGEFVKTVFGIIAGVMLWFFVTDGTVLAEFEEYRGRMETDLSLLLLFELVLYIVSGIILSMFLVFTPQKQAKVLEWIFGKRAWVVREGIGIRIPFLLFIRKTLDYQIQYLSPEEPIEEDEEEGEEGRIKRTKGDKTLYVLVKTKDNVFVRVPVGGQIRVIRGQEMSACYELDNPQKTLAEWMLEAVSVAIAGYDHDDIYSERKQIALEVMDDLNGQIKPYGREFVKIIIHEPDPGKQMRDSYEQVRSAAMLKKAAVDKAAAQAIELSGAGRGAALSLKAMIVGVLETAGAIHKANGGIEDSDCTELVMEALRLQTISKASEGGSAVVISTNGEANLPAGVAAGIAKIASDPSKLRAVIEELRSNGTEQAGDGAE